MEDYSYLGVLVDYFIKSKKKEELAASELLLEQRLLDKALEEIAENIDKVELVERAPLPNLAGEMYFR